MHQENNTNRYCGSFFTFIKPLSISLDSILSLFRFAQEHPKITTVFFLMCTASLADAWWKCYCKPYTNKTDWSYLYNIADSAEVDEATKACQELCEVKVVAVCNLARGHTCL